jgi:hypothetical protein
MLVLVLDLGGGTFDASVLEVGNGLVEVIATSGDSRLGGNDFTQCIVDWIVDRLREAGGVDPSNNPLQMSRIYKEAEQAKIRLSNAKEVTIELKNLHGEVGVHSTLTRSQFEKMCDKPLVRMLAPIREVAIMACIDLPGESGSIVAYDTDEDDEPILDLSAPLSSAQLNRLKKKQQTSKRKSRDNRNMCGFTEYHDLHDLMYIAVPLNIRTP